MDRNMPVLKWGPEWGNSREFKSSYRLAKYKTRVVGFTIFSGSETWWNYFFEPLDIVFFHLAERYGS